VVSVILDDRDAVADGHRLNARFAAQIPEQLTTGLIGLATSRAWNTVTLFDKQSGRVHGVVPTGRAASGVALDRQRLRAYVAAPGADTVATIDLLSNRIIDRLQMQVGDRPTELVLIAGGAVVLTANAGSNTVSFVDTQRLFEIDRLPVGTGPAAIALDPERSRAYVFNRLGDTISLIDLTARRVVLTAATDAAPVRGAFDRRGATLFVIHASSPYLTLFNPDLTIRSRVFVGPGASALTVDQRTDRVYLARRGTDSIDVYDPSSLLPIDAIPTDGDVSFLAIDGELNNLAVLTIETRGIRLINLTNRDPVAEIDLGPEPYWVTFLGEG
ncbi:MAG TPA: YncE family protein, partial [Candidatus Polarisedimenticolaceae bacterium]|nr:YncE family protein [Candidatus Polarisedimenticolaceae bacterium]